MMVVKLHEYKQTKEYYNNNNLGTYHTPKNVDFEKQYIQSWIKLLSNNIQK